MHFQPDDLRVFGSSSGILGSGPKKNFGTTSKSLRYEENLQEIARGLTYFVTHPRNKK